MAATYRTSAAGGGTSGSVDRTVTITTLANDLLLVFAQTSGNTNTAATCSDNQGGTYTQIDFAANSASANTATWFVRNSLVGTGASTIITVVTGSNTAGEIVAVAMAGMSRTGLAAIRSKGKQVNQAAGTPAPVLSQAALTGNPTIGAVFNASTPAGMTTPTGWTERQDVGQSTPSTGIEVVTRDSGFTGTTVTWGSASATAYASAIVELDSSLAEVLGTSTPTVGVTEAQTGTVLVQGSSAQTISVTKTVTGQVEIQAVTGGGTVNLSPTTTGAVLVQGVSSRTISVSEASTGTVATGAISGVLAQTVALTPGITGRAEYNGGVNATVSLNLVVVGTVDTFGQGAVSVSLSGSSTAIAEIHGVVAQEIAVTLDTTHSVIAPRLATTAGTIDVSILLTGKNPPLPVPNPGRAGFMRYINGRFGLS